MHILEKNLKDTSVLNWSTQTIGDISNITSGGTPDTNIPEYWDKAEVPWLSSGEVANVRIKSSKKFISALGLKESSAKKIAPGAVLIALAGQGKTRGQVAVTDIEVSTNQSVAAVMPKQEISSDFLYYNLRARYDELRLISGGESGRGGLNLGIISRMSISVPPLAEQTAIANILSDQEALIAQYDNLIALHEKRFAYLSDELLSGRVLLRLDDDGTIVCSKNEGWQEVDLNGDTVKIPKNWNTATLPDLCVLTNGSSFKPSEKEEYGIPIVRIQNLTDVTSEYHYYNGSKKGLVPLGTGDLLFSWSGTIGIYTYTLSSGYLNQHIFKVTPFKIDGAYAKYFLRRNIDKFQRSGLTMPHITLAEIRKRKLVVCFDETQQKLIGKVLSDQEALIAEYKKLRDAEKKRFDWLSDALLSGTYRVKVEA